jgi:hypothetical protein
MGICARCGREFSGKKVRELTVLHSEKYLYFPLQIQITEGINPASSSFFPVNRSYAGFTPEGKLSITSQEAREGHRCHSIAFHVTGDLVFSPFP